MEIIIDCNNDTVELVETGVWKVKHPNQFIPIFEEIFNRLNVSNVILTRVDEDNRQTIAEW